MRFLPILIVGLFLSGCNPPQPLTAEVNEAINKCLAKDWIPQYFSNGIKTQFDCIPKDIVAKQHTN